MPSLFKIDISANRIYGLDILRALAIFFVVLDHSQHTLTHNSSEFVSQFFRLYSWYMRYVVFDGVAIFFVLSGFLIGGILIKNFHHNKVTLKALLNFWIKRWVRTLPAYLFILTLLVLFSLTFDAEFNGREAAWYYIFLQNFNSPHPVFFPEAWSLSVEEWFYLLIPSSIFIGCHLFRLPFKISFMVAAISVLLFSIGVRYHYFYEGLIGSHQDYDLLIKKQVIGRLDSLMFGLIGAYCLFYHPVSWVKYKNRLFILGLITMLVNKYLFMFYTPADDFYKIVFSFTVTSISVLLMLPYLQNFKSGSGFIFQLLTYTSLISYSMYLLNLSFIQMWLLEGISFFIRNDLVLGITKFVLYWVLLIVLSVLMYKYIEQPFMRVREKLVLK